MKVKITVLVDDRSERSDLLSEHGLSIWVETDLWNILFDTGQTDAFFKNADRLKIPVRQVDHIILSHGHYDHTGGIPEISDLIGKARIHIHPDALSLRYRRCEKIPHKAVGMRPSTAFRLLDAHYFVDWTRAPIEIEKQIYLTGSIPRRHKLEKNNSSFFFDPGCTIPDRIVDDQALFIQSGKGLIVFLGCAHAGVMNTLDFICEWTGSSKVYAVIGGMHLLNADWHRLETTAEALARFRVKYLLPCHCTGNDAIEILENKLPGHVVSCSTGTSMVLG